MSRHPWWRGAVIYEIYPRSFQDSNGDGIGDLAGVERRIDYLAGLGIDAVWIAPIYPSPMQDFGYDVSDYRGIDPIFGTLADFDRLLAALHARNLRLILDFVPNHSSDQHPWFLESRSSRTNPKRDWYIWRDPAPGGGPPNNWISQAGGGGWAWDEATGQYYYHAFLASQPDLNWRNPAVRAAMHEVMRFWLDRGVDGFRVDVLWHVMKDPLFRDDPPNPDFQPGDPPFKQVLPLNSADQEGILDTATELRRLIESYPGERLFIAEAGLPLERHMAYYGPVHLPFNFALIWASWSPAIWRPSLLMPLIRQYMGALPAGGWPNWVVGNHDQPRVASRIGPAQARIAMMLLLTLQGTPTLYQGDELGLANVPIPPDRVRDPFGINMPGTGQGRDPERTPMRWDGTPGAGFTTGEPWLPIGAEAVGLDVETERADPGSMLALTRALLDLRRREPALTLGEWAPLETPDPVLAYIRGGEGDRFLVVLNLADSEASMASRIGTGRVEVSTHAGRAGDRPGNEIGLRGNEGLVIRLDTSV